MSGCCAGNVDSRRPRPSTRPSAEPAGRRAEGEINRPDKLVVDPGRSSSGRGVRFPPVSTINPGDPFLAIRAALSRSPNFCPLSLKLGGLPGDHRWHHFAFHLGTEGLRRYPNGTHRHSCKRRRPCAPSLAHEPCDSHPQGAKQARFDMALSTRFLA